ncbi:MAG: DUF4276 family protein [Nitrospirae bacterium]|nr:DUF4276 family protein [Nitrospirota bacterium]
MEVIREILNKIDKGKFHIKPITTDGCGKLRRKCDGYVTDLFNRGSDVVFVFHDSDTGEESKIVELRKDLTAKVMAAKPRGRACIVIPIQEIEAWLLADEDAINGSFSKLSIKAYPNPEAVDSPKETIERLSKGANSKPRYTNTTHNRKIAARLDLDKVYKKCPSFAPFYDVVSSL